MACCTALNSHGWQRCSSLTTLKTAAIGQYLDNPMNSETDETVVVFLSTLGAVLGSFWQAAKATRLWLIAISQNSSCLTAFVTPSVFDI